MLVLIGIQARSTSERFPGKVFADIEGRPMLQYVIDACNKATNYLNKYSNQHGFTVKTCVLIPTGDPIKQAFRNVDIVEGPEHDVLTRYMNAVTKYDPQYIVRITSDCPAIRSSTISKHVSLALKNRLDYVSNVFETIRTSFDGDDVEVISRQFLEKLNALAVEATHREHVTLLARQKIFKEYRIGHVIGDIDHSHIKLSVDTPEDLQNVIQHFRKIRNSLDIAQRMNGRESVYRIHAE